MAQTLPYLASYKNLGDLFAKIATAQRPSAFTHTYLRDTIGLKSTSDRALIGFLRALNFLDKDNRPTASYDLLKNAKLAKGAIADGVRAAYAPLFKANENANSLSGDELRGLIAQVTGSDTDAAKRIANTFAAIVKQGDFGAQAKHVKTDDSANKQTESQAAGVVGLRPEFHYNIQIHLPANGTEETYLNIFNALRRTFR